jgi:predicted Zn-dependent peptidase
MPLLRSSAAIGCLPFLLPLLILNACSRQAGDNPETNDERLPGRSRPLLQHDWPHPRDYRFPASGFVPPSPDKAMVTTRTGVRAFIVADDAAPLVRLTAALPLGRAYEGAGEAGAAALLTQILLKDSTAGGPPLSLRLEELGTRVDIEEDWDLTRVTVDVLPEDWRPGLAVLVDMLRRAEVDPPFVRAYRAGPGYVAVTAGVAGHGFRPKVELERRLLGYPLAPPDPGTEVAVDAVRAIAARSLRPDSVVLGIGGRASRSEVESALNELTADWQLPSDHKPTLAALTPDANRRLPLQTIPDDSLEGWIAIGRVIGPVPAADRPALAVLGEILNIRLNIATREIRGLSNRTSFEVPDTGTGSGLLLVRSGGRTEAVAPLVKFSLDEITRIGRRDDAISPEEMEQGKGILALGKWQGALEGALMAPGTFAAELVRRGTTDDLMKWPEVVNAVTPEQVKGAAAKYLQPDTMAVVVIGPLEKIRAARHPRWPVSLDELTSPRQTARAGQP